MAAALALLGDWQGTGRRIAVLGEMRELGNDASAYHTRLAPLIAANRIDCVHAVGDFYDAFWQMLPKSCRGRRANTPDELKAALLDELRDGDVLLLKGSHGSLIHELVDWLKRVGKSCDERSAEPKH